MGRSISSLIESARDARPTSFDPAKLEAEELRAVDGDRHEGCGGMLSDRSPPSIPFWRSGSFDNPSATRGDLSERQRVPLVLACARCKKLYRSAGVRIDEHEESGAYRVAGYELDGVLTPR